MATIVGRKQELRELHELYHSNAAQLVAVYGRRRVGKTFLIDEAKSRSVMQDCHLWTRTATAT